MVSDISFEYLHLYIRSQQVLIRSQCFILVTNSVSQFVHYIQDLPSLREHLFKKMGEGCGDIQPPPPPKKKLE
jgi:hypothetical protein